MGCSPDTIRDARGTEPALRSTAQQREDEGTLPPQHPSRAGAATCCAGRPGRKDRPTPTRKEAEAARRQRVARNLSKKEARLEASRHARAERMRAINARDATPEKLLRDYVDARFNLGEFLLPSLVVILALTFLSQSSRGWQSSAPWVCICSSSPSSRFRDHVARVQEGAGCSLPKASPRGLLLYGMNRGIQIRRFRMPPPRVKRGEKKF